MIGPPNDEGRPRAKERPANVVATDFHHGTAIPRCKACGAALSAPMLGPVCHRRGTLATLRILLERRVVA